MRLLISCLMIAAMVVMPENVVAQHVKFKGIPLGMEVGLFKQKMLEKFVRICGGRVSRRTDCLFVWKHLAGPCLSDIQSSVKSVSWAICRA